MGQGSTPSLFGVSDKGNARADMRALLDRYGMWVHRCVLLNARMAASVPFKLLSLRAGVEQKVYGSRPRPLTREFRAYLMGRQRLRPGTVVCKAVQANLENAVEIEKHPVLDLMHDVNPWTDGYQYRVSLYADRQIFGRAFMHLIGEPLPLEIWRMEPHLTKVIPHPDLFVQAYEYGEGASKATFGPDDVIWFRTYDPGNPWGGIGPLEAWLRTVDAAFAIQAFQHDLFERGGSPDWAVVGESQPTAEQRRTFLSDWRARFGRLWKRKDHVTFVSGKPQPELVKLNDTPRELEFGASENAKRDQLCAAFGVPKSKVTTDDVNRANAEETDEVHLREVWSDIQEVEDCLNQRLVSRYGDGLLLVHESPVREDQTIRIQERASQLASGYSVNQILTDDGRDPVGPDGDVPLVAAGLKTLDQIVNPPEPMLGPLDLGGEEPAEEEPEPAKAIDVAALVRKELEPVLARLEALKPREPDPPIDVAAVVRQELVPVVAQLEALEPREPDPAVAVKQLTDQMRAALEPILVRVEAIPPPVVKVEAAVLSQAALWDQYYAGSLNGEVSCCKAEKPARPKAPGAALIARIRRVFREQFSETAKALEELGLAEAGRVAAAPRWQEMLADTLKPAMELLIERGGKGGLGRLPAGVDFDVHNPAVQEFVDRYVVRLSEQIAGSTEVLLSKLFDDRLAKGATTRDIAVGIRELDQAVSPYRAEMIARTESARAYVAGETEGWRMSGVVTAKEWLLAPDACEFCAAVAKEYEGRSVGLDDRFYEVGHVLTGVDGGRMKLDYEQVQGPPLHPNCRCDLLPVVEAE